MSIINNDNINDFTKREDFDKIQTLVNKFGFVNVSDRFIKPYKIEEIPSIHQKDLSVVSTKLIGPHNNVVCTLKTLDDNVEFSMYGNKAIKKKISTPGIRFNGMKIMPPEKFQPDGPGGDYIKYFPISCY